MFLDDIGKALKFLAECFRMIAEEPKLLLPSLLSVVFGFFMSLIVIVPFVFMGLLGKIGLVMFGGSRWSRCSSASRSATSSWAPRPTPCTST